jgi:hypothetical protein
MKFPITEFFEDWFECSSGLTVVNTVSRRYLDKNPDVLLVDADGDQYRRNFEEADPRTAFGRWWDRTFGSPVTVATVFSALSDKISVDDFKSKMMRSKSYQSAVHGGLVEPDRASGEFAGFASHLEIMEWWLGRSNDEAKK